MDDMEMTQLFQLCDKNESGYIEMEDLEEMFSSLDIQSNTIWDIFGELDADGDGRICFQEFCAGFNSIAQHFITEEEPQPSSDNTIRRVSIDLSSKGSIGRARGRAMLEKRENSRNEFSTFTDSFEEDIQVMNDSCCHQIINLNEELKEKCDDKTRSKFKLIVYGVVRQMNSISQEVIQLETSLKKVNETHSQRIRSLEDEMEVNIERVEREAYLMAEQEATQQRKEAEKRIEGELQSLRESLEYYRRREALLEQKEAGSTGIKSSIEDLTEENRRLRSSVTEAQTAIAMLRMEMSHVLEQQQAMDRERKKVSTYQEEIKNLSSQLAFMYATNRRLHDTSDELRSALESSSIQKGIRLPNKSCSLLSELMAEGGDECKNKRKAFGRYSNSIPSTSSDHHRVLATPHLMSPQGDHLWSDEADSGRYSQVSEWDDGDSASQEDNVSPEDSVSMILQRPRRSTAGAARHALLLQHEESVECDEPLESLQESPPVTNSTSDTIPTIMRMSSAPSNSSAFLPPESANSLRSPTSFEAQHNMQCANSNDTIASEQSFETIIRPQGSHLERLNNDKLYLETKGEHEGDSSLMACDPIGTLSPISVDTGVLQPGKQPTLKRKKLAELRTSKSVTHHESTSSMGGKVDPSQQVAKPMEQRMYRVVFAGDASVGKSSFILQLCSGVFHNCLTSTLGVDFHNKCVEMDGRLANLQLWDTAGQERFRSMAMSYFRRADGVILMYDATYERSFLSVRDWVETVESGAGTKLPMIICANKFDLEEECASKHIPFVTRREGQILADSYNALFSPVSAKTGFNVNEATLALSRAMWEAEDRERAESIKLGTKTEDDSKCCMK